MTRPVLKGVALALACLLPVLAWQEALSLGVGAASLLALLLGGLWPSLAPARSARPVEPLDVARIAGVSAFPDPVVTLDRRGIVTDANPAATAILPGLRVARPLAFGLRDPDVIAAAERAIETGRPERAELGGHSAKGPVHDVRIVPLGGGPGEVALFFRDLTEQRRLEATRVDFIANVSHELRTPLASLLGFIETLQGPARDDAAARTRFLEVMAAQSHRMRRLVDDLLRLSRVELREHVAPTERIDLAAAVRHMIEIMRPAAADRGIALEVAVADEPLVVTGDRDELLRVVENLVENAMRYGSQRGDSVEIGLGRQGAGVAMTVRDHGAGIPADHIPRLTERFYRVAGSGNRQESGTGLGLAIVKHIVGRHRGRLSIESRIGDGSTFTVSLPAATPER